MSHTLVADEREPRVSARSGCAPCRRVQDVILPVGEGQDITLRAAHEEWIVYMAIASTETIFVDHQRISLFRRIPCRRHSHDAAQRYVLAFLQQADHILHLRAGCATRALLIRGAHGSSATSVCDIALPCKEFSRGDT